MPYEEKMYLDKHRLPRLDGGRLVGERTLEERRDDVGERVGDVLLQGGVGVLPVVRGVRDDGHVEQEGAFEQLPHVVAVVDLLHLDLFLDLFRDRITLVVVKMAAHRF